MTICWEHRRGFCFLLCCLFLCLCACVSVRGAECRTDEDCATSEVCNNGFCRSAVLSDASLDAAPTCSPTQRRCPDGYECHTSNYKCVYLAHAGQLCARFKLLEEKKASECSLAFVCSGEDSARCTAQEKEQYVAFFDCLLRGDLCQDSSGSVMLRCEREAGLPTKNPQCTYQVTRIR